MVKLRLWSYVSLKQIRVRKNLVLLGCTICTSWKVVRGKYFCMHKMNVWISNPKIIRKKFSFAASIIIEGMYRYPQQSQLCSVTYYIDYFICLVIWWLFLMYKNIYKIVLKREIIKLFWCNVLSIYNGYT